MLQVRLDVAKKSRYTRLNSGFFSDSTGARALDAVVDAGDTTVESCVAACQAKGYFLAGLEFGRECCEFPVTGGVCSVGVVRSDGIVSLRFRASAWFDVRWERQWDRARELPSEPRRYLLQHGLSRRRK